MQVEELLVKFLKIQALGNTSSILAINVLIYYVFLEAVFSNFRRLGQEELVLGRITGLFLHFVCKPNAV